MWRGDRQQSAVSRQGPPIYCHTDTIHCRGSTHLLSDEYPLLSIENSIFTGDIIADTVTVSCQALPLQLSACVLMLSRFMSPPLLWIWSWNCFFSPLSIVDAMPEYRDIRSSAHEQVLEGCLPISHPSSLHVMFVNVHLYKCRCHVGERKRQIPH